MAAYRRVYDSRHVQADCQQPVSAGMGDRGAAVVKFIISIPRESCTNAKAKYSSSVVPPDPSVHFYHCSSPVAAKAFRAVSTVNRHR